MTRPQGMMSMKLFESLVDQAIGLGVETVSIFGFGEPLMDHLLAERVRYCTRRMLKTFITTNAAMLTPDVTRELMDAGLTDIRFSVHGLTEEEYEKFHKGLKYTTVMSNIEGFLWLNRHVTTNVTVMLTNGHKPEQVDEIKRFWERQVDYLEIWKPHGWAGRQKYRKDTQEYRKCFRPFSGPIQVQWDGMIIPCCFMTDAEVVLGDANKDSLLDILKGEPYNEFRAKHESGKELPHPCDRCDQRFILDYNPLLYSSRDKDRKINTTSSIKYNLEGE